jgi:formate dehydrogenase iron-sulfur subunit
MAAGLLFDATQCIGCEACVLACKEQNRLPERVDSDLTAYTWATVRPVAGTEIFTRRLCMHCLEPTCVSVCPVGALYKTAEGPVAYDASKCIGCRYCMMACPFDVPKFQWDRLAPVIGKCVLCADRVTAGRPTACAEACPTGATMFGERGDLLREAEARIAAEPAKYVGHVYGKDEAGGTSVLMLSSVPFERMGLPPNVPRRPLPMLTWEVLSRVPDFVGVTAAFLFGLNWITHRRDEVRAFERASAVGHESSRWARLRNTWRRIRGRRDERGDS